TPRSVGSKKRASQKCPRAARGGGVCGGFHRAAPWPRGANQRVRPSRALQGASRIWSRQSAFFAAEPLPPRARTMPNRPGSLCRCCCDVLERPVTLQVLRSRPDGKDLQIVVIGDRARLVEDTGALLVW